MTMEEENRINKNREKRKLFERIYFNPTHPSSFSSVKKLYESAKEIDRNITYHDAKTFLQNTRTYTSHKPIQFNFLRRKTIVRGINDQWQLDLISTFRIGRHNNNTSYLLAAIDCFSRYAYVEPLKNKKAETTLEGFKRILQRSKQKPRLIQVDQGSEFKGVFKKYLTENNIHSFSTSQDTKAAIVERFIRTIQNRIYRFLSAENTLRYIDALQDIVTSYNNTRHRTIGISPSDVNERNEREIWNKQYKKYLHSRKDHLPFSVGDKVRISTKRKTFNKGYLAKWQEEIFQIAFVLRTWPATYILIDRDNEILSGSFYSQELNKVKGI